jgi:hypothetical protein
MRVVAFRKRLSINNKKKGEGNGNSVINNHEFKNKTDTSSNHSSTDDVKDVKGNKNEK